ncbi:MAG: T9SS type A sorting domain-containing protein [Bacteroidetes bacterium]|nr:T9SS type A sorting domain-containing protein [Bacteroidota bacterium]
MKKRLIFVTIGVLVLIGSVHSQRCDTENETFRAIQSEHAYTKGLFELDSLAEAFETWTLESSARGDTIMFIPVVVHVIYRHDVQNISYDQIKSQIDVLNRDFNWAGGDHGKIPEVFRSLGQACRIQFRLADRDPHGNFTHGITRKQTDIEDIGSQAIYHRSSKGGTDPWSQPHYLNIWVCELEGNAIGFSILPSNNMSERDGVVMDPNAFGTTGTVRPPYNGGRTLVHEVGHYLGLRHPWGKGDGGGCSTTDHMSDTPKQEKENFGCETFPHFSCGGQTDGDMFMNFMDYANDSCMLPFTKQQVQFMRLVLRRNRAALFHSDGYTGLSKMNERSLRIYPNPANDRLQIEFLHHDQLVNVWSVEGKLMKVLRASASITEFDISNLESGMYFLESEDSHLKLMVQ